MKIHKRGINKEDISPRPYCDFMLCDRWPHPRAIITMDNSEVTCKKCLKILAKEAKHE